jgi:hypothetical protein
MWKYLKKPTIYKPLMFIFLVVVAPGITEPMFYYESNVLNFTAENFALLNMLGALGSITGVWLYRVAL